MFRTFAAFSLVLAAADPFAASRERMVLEQIKSRGVRNVRVLDAIRAVPRHLFVPVEMRSEAYSDRPLAIGHGQTISQPYIVAAMSELLDLQANHKVLEVGTGSAYQAAILSKLAGHVYTIEIVPQLASSARALLRTQGYANVTVRAGDGYAGWPEEAPFDRIILTAAPLEVPQALLDQLKSGGKLIAPVGGANQQELIVIEKDQKGQVSRREVFPVRFVPMVK